MIWTCGYFLSPIKSQEKTSPPPLSLLPPPLPHTHPHPHTHTRPPALYFNKLVLPVLFGDVNASCDPYVCICAFKYWYQLMRFDFCSGPKSEMSLWCGASPKCLTRATRHKVYCHLLSTLESISVRWSYRSSCPMTSGGSSHMIWYVCRNYSPFWLPWIKEISSTYSSHLLPPLPLPLSSFLYSLPLGVTVKLVRVCEWLSQSQKIP